MEETSDAETKLGRHEGFVSCSIPIGLYEPDFVGAKLAFGDKKSFFGNSIITQFPAQLAKGN